MGVYEVRKGMSSYLDFREPKGLHLLVWALASVSDHGVVESRCCTYLGVEMNCREVQCPYYFQVAGMPVVTREFCFYLRCCF